MIEEFQNRWTAICDDCEKAFQPIKCFLNRDALLAALSLDGWLWLPNGEAFCECCADDLPLEYVEETEQ